MFLTELAPRAYYPIELAPLVFQQQIFEKLNQTLDENCTRLGKYCWTKEVSFSPLLKYFVKCITW